jgi:SNF2 family DNA or RNA helicase
MAIVTIGKELDPHLEALFRKDPFPPKASVYHEISPKLQPYPYQEVAVSSCVDALERDGYFALFMEMGTGKTKCTIDTLMVMASRDKIDGLVVVAPKAILATWAACELPKHMNIPYQIYVWDGKDTKKSQREFDLFMAGTIMSVFIVNVEAFQRINDTMRSRLKTMLAHKRSLVVVDESSFIKAHDAKRSKNLVGLSKIVPYRMILTGTELVNSPLDVFMQMRFLLPAFWGALTNWLYFRAHYAKLEDEYGAGGRIHKKVVGYQRMDELMGRIAPHCYRALIRDHLRELPERIFSVIPVELSDTQRGIYESLKKHLAAIINGEVMTVENKMSLFTKFRQIPGGTILVEGEHRVIEEWPPKLEALLAKLEDTDGQQVIIWAAFTHEIDMILKALAPLGIAVPFHGEVEQKRRDRNMLDFQEGRARFFVGNPQAAGYGLNLQNCHIQITYSRVLSPAQVWQADARTYRPGQKHVCLYYSLVAEDTVDERIEKLLAAKTDIRESFQTMTMQDMYDLV